ncbi:MAG: molybdopterin cofactor-binding domain-containing protein, partial [Myxococcota bacterium]
GKLSAPSMIDPSLPSPVIAETAIPAIAVEDATGLSRDKVKVHGTLLGGGFGRRGESDYVREAAWLAKARKGTVRVQWSREDDMQHDFFRPASLHRLRGHVEGGSPVAWEHLAVQQSPMERAAPAFLREVLPSALAGMAVSAMTGLGNDGSIIEGADSLPYAIPNLSVGYHKATEPVLTGFWRSVGHSSTGFVVESFIDELAHAAEADPYEFRRKLLKDQPRHLKTLETAAEAAKWGTELPEGRARGIAVVHSFSSYVAVVAECSVTDGDIRVHKLTAAVDCGTVVHPDGVKAQIEGGMIFALGPTLTQAEITFKEGRVEQSNFHDFQTLRYAAAPEVEVVLLDSDEPPTGVGEPGVPPTAPAVANAVFAITGQRLRRLPLKLA